MQEGRPWPSPKKPETVGGLYLDSRCEDRIAITH